MKVNQERYVKKKDKCKSIFIDKIKFFNINFLFPFSSYLPQAVWLHLGEKDQNAEVCWEDLKVYI